MDRKPANDERGPRIDSDCCPVSHHDRLLLGLLHDVDNLRKGIGKDMADLPEGVGKDMAALCKRVVRVESMLEFFVRHPPEPQT